MLQTILIITLILMLALLALIIIAACIAGGREDRVMEHMYEKWEQEHPERKQQTEEMEG